MQETLAALFAIEVGFRGELSNHLHLIFRTRPDVVESWSDKDVVRRWLTITKLAKSQDGQPKPPSKARMAMERVLPGRVKQIRENLSNPSWFMGILSEYIGRRSNREDDCTGHFWEDRFDCRELADEAAILVCGIYVDLNQIRAGEAPTPETSTHTSAYDRILDRAARLAQREPPAKIPPGQGEIDHQSAAGWLCELTLDESVSVNSVAMRQSASGRRATDKGILPITLDDYLKLLDASGRVVQQGKSGSIPDHLAPIIERLGIKRNMWTELVTDFDSLFGRVVGKPSTVAKRATDAGRRWFRGVSNCADAFG